MQQNLLQIYDEGSHGEKVASDIATCYFCAATLSASIGSYKVLRIFKKTVIIKMSKFLITTTMMWYLWCGGLYVICKSYIKLTHIPCN